MHLVHRYFVGGHARTIPVLRRCFPFLGRKTGQGWRKLLFCRQRGESVDVLTEKIVSYCMQHNVISASDEAWFRYGIKKRLTSVLCMIPLVALAVFLSDIPTAVSFYASFLLLRERTSGYHARTPTGCLSTSVLMELLFFLGMYPHLDTVLIIVSSGLSTVVIFFLAPYAHPNMCFAHEELLALRFAGRTTALIFLVATMVCQFSGLHSVSKGLAIGITMTAFALCLAYFIDWRDKNEIEASSAE